MKAIPWFVRIIARGIIALRRREHPLDQPWYMARLYMYYCHLDSNIPTSCFTIDALEYAMNDFFSVPDQDVTPDAEYANGCRSMVD